MSLDELLNQIPVGPKKIYHVSKTQLNIGLYCGRCKLNGLNYVYDPTDDSLTREDVFKKEQKAKRKKKGLSGGRWERE